MQLSMIETDGDLLKAGYSCPCGCTPTATYTQGGEVATDVCCCGNEFAVGHGAERHLQPRDGFVLEAQDVTAPWPEPVQAAWLVGPSVHPEPSGADSEHGHGHHHDDASQTAAIDPVCGMNVEPEAALPRGLHSNHKAVDYYFCGKGCKLEFDEDPELYLDPAYVPSM